MIGNFPLDHVNTMALSRILVHLCKNQLFSIFDRHAFSGSPAAHKAKCFILPLHQSSTIHLSSTEIISKKQPTSCKYYTQQQVMLLFSYCWSTSHNDKCGAQPQGPHFQLKLQLFVSAHIKAAIILGNIQISGYCYDSIIILLYAFIFNLFLQTYPSFFIQIPLSGT